jgi:uncharacterized protein YggU (UPF0235/DUF167 family)
MPRSSRNGIDGVRDGRLVVRITAPPVDNQANEAAAAMLADALGVARGAIRLVSGHAARNKVFEIEGLSATDLEKRSERFSRST